MADVTSDVILVEDLAALQFSVLDPAKYRPLLRIVSSWLNVKLRVLGLRLVGRALQWRQWLAHQTSGWFGTQIGAA